MNSKYFFIIVFAVIIIAGCTEKFDTGELPLDVELPDVIGDTTYIQIGRAWTDFNQPRDVIVGFDQLVYVADSGNDRIVMLDLGGNVQGISQRIPNPVAIAQDRRLNLLIAASHDTTDTDGNEVRLAAVYKINLFAAEHHIDEAPVEKIAVESLARQRIRYTGVAALHNNEVYVTRRGPQNVSPINPDNAIMRFSNDYELLGRESWPALVPTGSGLRSVNQPSDVATFPNRQTTDFVVSMVAEESQFKVQWLTLRQVGDLLEWDSFLRPDRDAGADLLRDGLFTRPEGLVVDRDNNIFVVDADQDMVYRFNSQGFERHSFGGPDIFYEPQGIAIDPNRTVYVADTGNNRILRFRLSTDL